MAKKKGGFVAAMDNLPWILKLILALPGLDFIWGIYRAVKGLNKKNLFLTIIGILWIFAGIPVLWIVDLITVIIYGKPTVLVD
ncbi:MAG: hypothetical protein RBQ97_04390 [Acholeplasma sp.]|nr:hypothetical protein [Acholeplasma sp.]